MVNLNDLQLSAKEITAILCKADPSLNQGSTYQLWRSWLKGKHPCRLLEEHLAALGYEMMMKPIDGSKVEPRERWYTTSEIARAVGKSRQAVFARAKREGWMGRPKLSGMGLEYPLEALPEDWKDALT